MNDLLKRLETGLTRSEWLKLLVILGQEPDEFLSYVQSYCMSAFEDAFDGQGQLTERVVI